MSDMLVVSVVCVVWLILFIGMYFFTPYNLMFGVGDSMKPTFDHYNLNIVKEVDDKESLEEGDIVAFKNPDKSEPLIQHRIVDVDDNNGYIVYTYQGDNNIHTEQSIHTEVKYKYVRTVIEFNRFWK